MKYDGQYKEDTTFLSNRIYTLIERASGYFYNDIMNQMHSEYRGEYGAYYGDTMRLIFNNIVVYLELKGLDTYLKMFISKFQDRMNNSNEIVKHVFIDIDEAPESLMLNEFRDFIDPFKDFAKVKRQGDDIKLERFMDILRSTKKIIDKSGISISNETSIYREVLWCLQLYYSSTRHKNKAGMVSQFKTYNPDILVPELKAAVEYKYVRNNQNIGDFLDQIYVDSVNYTGDDRYKIFVAVVCLEKGNINTHNTIKQSWEERNMPESWHLIIVDL